MSSRTWVWASCVTSNFSCIPGALLAYPDSLRVGRLFEVTCARGTRQTEGRGQIGPAERAPGRDGVGPGDGRSGASPPVPPSRIRLRRSELLHADPVAEGRRRGENLAGSPH